MLIQEKITVSNILVCVVRPRAEENIFADIVLYHGWGSTAARQKFRAQILASCGYCVYVPELVNHGERGKADYLIGKSADIFLQTLEQSLVEFPKLAVHLRKDRPLFLLGHSLGGLIALGCVHGNAGILSGVAAMNSTIDWNVNDNFFKNIYLEDDRDAEWNEDIVIRLEAFKPINWSGDARKIPVLLTNGTLDSTIPADYNKSYIDEYHPANVEHLLIEDAGHVVTDHTLEAVANFFANILNGKYERD